MLRFIVLRAARSWHIAPLKTFIARPPFHPVTGSVPGWARGGLAPGHDLLADFCCHASAIGRRVFLVPSLSKGSLARAPASGPAGPSGPPCHPAPRLPVSPVPPIAAVRQIAAVNSWYCRRLRQ